MNKSCTFEQQFDAIRNDRKGIVNSSQIEGIKKLMSEIYPDKAHFIYELLQNAEDTGAKTVRFTIQDKDQRLRLVFTHNGPKQFDDKDVDAITGIGNSTKNDYIQAGKFGIGFKSVFAFTESPYIYCDTVDFQIQDYLMPVLVEPFLPRPAGETWFVFPFNSPKIDQITARKRISEGLSDIRGDTLLFLHNISEIHCTLMDGTKKLIKSSISDDILTITEQSNQQYLRKNSWMKFSKKIRLHDKEACVDIAFKVVLKGEKHEFAPTDGNAYITFLAHNENTGLRFCINAPFGCTPSRDCVNKEDDNNALLVREIGKLTAEAMQELSDRGLFAYDFLEILPQEDDNVVEFFSPIAGAIFKAFEKKRLLHSEDGHKINSSMALMASSKARKIFQISDYRLLFSEPALEFIKLPNRTSRAYRFLKQMGVREASASDVLIGMTKLAPSEFFNWISHMRNGTLIDMYAYLYDGILSLEKEVEKYEEYDIYDDPDYADFPEYEEEYRQGQLYHNAKEELEAVRTLKIVKGENDGFYAPNDIKIITENIAVPKDVIAASRAVTKNDGAVRFLTEIGVKSFGIAELEKYRAAAEKEQFQEWMGNVSDKDDPVDVARNIVEFAKSHPEDGMTSFDLSNKRIVWVWNRMHMGYLRTSPQECCLDYPYVDTGFSDAFTIHGKHTLGDQYMNLPDEDRKIWLNILERSGMLCKIKVERNFESTGYSTGYRQDYLIDDLQSYLDVKSIRLNRFIWISLTSRQGWNSFYDKNVYKRNRNYDARYSDSSVVRILKNAAWIPDKRGRLHVPSEVSRYEIDSRFVVDENNGFLDAIDFEKNVKDKQRIDEEEKRRKAANAKERTAAAAVLGFENPEEVEKMRQACEELHQLQELGIDIQQLISQKKNERERKRETMSQLLGRDEAAWSSSSEELQPYAVPDKQRREKSIRSEMENKTAPSKEHLTKEQRCTKEEKMFVRQEYSGVCQICHKSIYNKAGTRIFNATNLVDTGKMNEDDIRGLSTGWNTMCLCPNCSAEYRYGPVSIVKFRDEVENTVVQENEDRFYEFDIEMQGEMRVIRYTPRHLLALQTALKFFEDIS